MKELQVQLEEEKKRKKDLAWRLTKLRKELSSTSGGENFQLLDPLLRSAALTSISATLPRGVSSLILGIVIATVGIKKSESPQGIVGPHLEKMVEALAKGLQSAELWQPKADLGAALTIEKLSLIAFLGALILGRWVGVSKGNTLLESNNEVARITGDLLLLMLASTPYVKIAFAAMVKAAGADAKTEDLVSEILTFVFVYFTAVASTTGKNQNPEELIENLHAFLRRSLTKIGGFLSESRWEASYLPVAFEQARLALENDNFIAFFNASADLFEGIGVSKEKLDADFECVFFVADTLFASLTKGTDGMGAPGTAISVVA